MFLWRAPLRTAETVPGPSAVMGFTEDTPTVSTAAVPWGSCGHAHTLPSASILLSSDWGPGKQAPRLSSGPLLRFPSPPSGLAWGICFQSPLIAPLPASPRALAMLCPHL